MKKLPVTTKTQDSQKLAVEVMASSKIIHRGSKFNVHVSLKNPFDTPIKHTGWSWQLPPGLLFFEESPGNEDVRKAELQPGDSCSLVFRIAANHILATRRKAANVRGFPLVKETPAQLGENFISMNISYDKDGVEHWQEVQAPLNIYASPIEIYLGAIIGAVVGSFARKQTLGFELVLSGILGFFLVLVAKRRTDVQFGFSIEDWVGGTIVGFTVGYLGTSYFENFLPGSFVHSVR